MTKGFKDEDGKFRPTGKNNGLTSNQLKTESNSSNIDKKKVQMLKDKKEFVHGEPVLGFINHHAVTIDIDLKEKPQPQKGVDLKMHRTPLELGISGSLWNLSRRDISQGGQMQDTLRKEFTDGNLKLKSNIKPEDFKKLLDVWDRWHLNDLNAGTTKQRELVEQHKNDPKYAELDVFLDRPKAILKDFNADPDNGYSYGSEWLYEPLPKDVVEFIKKMKMRLHNNG